MTPEIHYMDVCQSGLEQAQHVGPPRTINLHPKVCPLSKSSLTLLVFPESYTSWLERFTAVFCDCQRLPNWYRRCALRHSHTCLDALPQMRCVCPCGNHWSALRLRTTSSSPAAILATAVPATTSNSRNLHTQRTPCSTSAPLSHLRSFPDQTAALLGVSLVHHIGKRALLNVHRCCKHMLDE